MRVLITGGAGFIGSNLAIKLLQDPEIELVVVLDNLSNGHYSNLKPFENDPKLQFIEGDIRNQADCDKACSLVDVISHQAALGSVPRSVKDPFTSFEVNVMGTINLMNAAVNHNITRIVLACSSSTYGDNISLPKIESNTGNPLSPYAVTKATLEQIAFAWQKCFGLEYVGLRYFNIFGPLQYSNNPYAAVIPIFINSALNDQQIYINGDGFTSRDFTYVDNAVEANILALKTKEKDSVNQIYNVACNERISLNELHAKLELIFNKKIHKKHREERPGDVKHSLADISKIKKGLNYNVITDFDQGLINTVKWHEKLKNLS